MKNLTRREALKRGSTVAVTAILKPLLRHPETGKEIGAVSQPETPFSPEDDLCFANATLLVEMLRAKKVSAVEVRTAHLAQIARVNPKVNAIVTRVDDEDLLAQARAADDALAKGNWLGPLHGLPIGVKDLHTTKGIRTTFGSPLFKANIPATDCLVAEREKKAGGIVIGKTNVPEFGLGSQTTNKVFGATLN
ncbi:MAG: amidase family protein, partial [Candidatus Acidiferrales bacterium]